MDGEPNIPFSFFFCVAEFTSALCFDRRLSELVRTCPSRLLSFAKIVKATGNRKFIFRIAAKQPCRNRYSSDKDSCSPSNMQGGSGFLAADGQTLSVADDDRPAVCERFYRIAVRTVDRYGTGGVDEMPARPVRTAAKPSVKSKPASYMGGINSRSPILKPHSPSRTRSSPRSAGVSGPQTAYRTSGFKFAGASAGIRQPGDAIADGIARLFEQCEAFCVGRTAVPDDFPGREQRPSPRL